MFRRRIPLTLSQKITGWVWPRGGFARAARCHVKRILRVPGSPHAIAAGVAAGIFAAFTPFVGLHVIMAAAVALLAGGNIIVSAMASLVGNPLTLPVFWIAGFEVGRVFVPGSGTALDGFIGRPSFDRLLPIIEPLTLGSLILGLAMGALVYLPVRRAVARAQEMRRDRLAARRPVMTMPGAGR